jgi:hypothetical protein
MWKSIVKKWTNNNNNDDFSNLISSLEPQLESKNQIIDNPSEFILTEISKRYETPSDNSIKLWPHQEAMLYRIQQIEKSGYICRTEHTEASISRYMDKKEAPKSYNVCLGIMNDPPGSGKTYAILTHIRIDLNTGPTIIIVPQNIYAQWRESIEKIFNNQLNICKFSTSYMDIMDMYSNPKDIERYKIILLLDSFAEAYLKVLNDNKINVCRVVVDEIDIMDKFVCSSINTKFVWLMSASYTNQKVLGPYHIGDHTKVICKCDSSFVEKSLNLPDPKIRTIECNDNHIQTLKDVLDIKQIKALNAGDHNILNRIINKSGLITPILYRDFMGKYSEYLLQKAELLPEAEKELENFRITDERSEKEYNILRDRVTMLRTFRNNAHIIQMGCEILTDNFLNECKEKYLEGELIDMMKLDKTSKWLIFNDNGNVLVRYQELLMKRDIKAIMLDGGNQKLIEKSLKDYKEGNVQVLLLNSMIEGAGMNLENTTHLLFMHKTEDKFIGQVMGRAQRYGRKEPLNVIILFNKNE